MRPCRRSAATGRPGRGCTIIAASTRLNRHRAQEALKLFEQSASAYLALAQPTLDAPAEGSQLLPTDTTSLEALFGLVEVKRNRAWALRELGRLADSEAELRGAEALVAKLPRTANHFDERETAFVYRTHGLTLAGQGQVGDAIGLLQHADRDFSLGYGGETQARAETKLILAAQLLAQNRLDEALATCGEAVRYLSPKEGVVADLMAPCLEAYVAGARVPLAQQRLAEMFEAAERIRGTQTNQQIQQAARRMAEDTRDPAAAALIGQRDLARQPAAGAGSTAHPAGAAGRSGRCRETRCAEARRREGPGRNAAARRGGRYALPRYNQNVPMAVSAKDVMAALRPGEAFLLTVLSEKTGWSMLLRDGRISVGRIDGGSMRVDMLVKRLRHTLEPLDDDRLHPFDFDASHEAGPGGARAARTATARRHHAHDLRPGRSRRCRSRCCGPRPGPRTTIQPHPGWSGSSRLRTCPSRATSSGCASSPAAPPRRSRGSGSAPRRT